MINAIEGGYETARLTAAEQDRVARQQREADALAFLTRTDNLDVAVILGLIQPAKPSRGRRRINGHKAVY